MTKQIMSDTAKNNERVAEGGCCRRVTSVNFKYVTEVGNGVTDDIDERN